MDDFYTSGKYSNINPSWDVEDSLFKFNRIKKILEKNDIFFKDICEVGCGAGEILNVFKKEYDNINVYGYDIASGLEEFWKEKKNINLYNSDFIKTNSKKYDVIFFSDVIEHLDSPFEYLEYSKKYSTYIVIYLPLDLSIRSLFIDRLIKKQINNVGHINFYTKNIFLEILKHKGFKVLDFNYNEPYKRKSNIFTLKSFINKSLRKFFRIFFSHDMYATIFGGETITLLIKS